jgi:hypothetical protein
MARHKSLGLAILFFGALAVSLLSGEFILRLQNSSMKNYNIEMWKYAKELKTKSETPELGHEHLRNKSEILQSVEIRLNEYGLRGRPLDPIAWGGRRILMLGGSIALGWGVPEEETVSSVLEQMFRDAGEEVQVLNAGVGNYNALRYTENYFRNLEETQPTDIIVLYFMRDAEELDAGGGNFLLRNSQLAVTVWAAFQNIIAPHGENVLIDHYNAVYDPASPGFQTMRSELGKLAEESKSRNIRIYLAMMPDVHNLVDYPFLKIHEQMKEIAGELGYSYVDLLPGFLNLKPEEIWAMPGDPHPNARGHKIMAEQLFPVLKDQQ